MKITEFKLKSGITGLLMHDWKSSKLSEYFKTDKIKINSPFNKSFDLESENEENKDIAELSKFGKKLDFKKYTYVSIDSNLKERGLLSDLEIVNSITVTEDNAERRFFKNR
ncbi:hypothetical protein BpHYR1_041124 [Brachionus plicatilis]|uniref:Uncharacterized protein n=1 Tax=Brachionus plicatilis TaxID=10195 RepID=A0A3M7S468_BRAPC|nr:hypothetical protein BpHYR1_041124 [Brachionus plicatilis]